MSLSALCLLLVCPVLLMLLAWRFFRQKAYRLTAIFIALAVLTGICGGVKGYEEMDSRAQGNTVSSFERDQLENMSQRYEQAVAILKQLDFNHPDKEKAAEAVQLLRNFQDEQLAQRLDGACPNAQTLLAYAEAMEQVAGYRGRLANKDVNADRKLLSIVQDMPEAYEGVLAEKIVPFRRLIIAMNAAGEKETKLDRENAQKHAQNLSRGKYGGIRAGDSEDNITAALGEPVRVSENSDNGQIMKQYVFNHNGRSIYVYTKDGIVTDVSM